MRKDIWRIALLCGMFCLAFCWGHQAAAYSSRDVRVALLVAHQHGWQGDPSLRYVISGDLEPLREIFESNGFEVVALRNPSPDAVRAAFTQLNQRTDISTFLFYYSGHGGKRHFHLGPRGKSPLSHDEFLQFFQKMRVKRRIALIDACFSGSLIRQWGKKKLDAWARFKFVPKGARYANFAILTKAKKYKSTLKGTQIITSSQSYSYESPMLKSSIFTHHLLEGLRGKADLNGDGQVSVHELFGYIQPRVKQEAEQSPQRWAHVEGEDYGLTPNQTSHLVVHAGTLGQLRIAIGNFFWRYQKTQRRTIKFRVTHGDGIVELQKGKRCFRQVINLPKDGHAWLGEQWKPYSCQAKGAVLAKKGLVTLPSQISVPWRWNFGVQGGVLGSQIGGGPFLGGGYLVLRHSYFALQLGFWGSYVDYQTSPRSHQLFADIRAEVGYRHTRQYIDIFVGGYASMGVLFQRVESAKAFPGGVFGYGLTATFGVWLTPNLSLTISGDVGFSLLQQGGEFRHPFGASGRLGFLYRFG